MQVFLLMCRFLLLLFASLNINVWSREIYKLILFYNSLIKYFIFVLGLHCDIYQSSYNISNTSNLNSPPPSFSFISLPHSWNNFNRSHCSNYIHVYTVFEPYSSTHSLSPSTPTSHWCQPLQAGPVLASCSLILWKKKLTFLTNSFITVGNRLKG
jgi:hypothetical protein